MAAKLESAALHRIILQKNTTSNKHIFSLAKIKFQAKEKIMDIKDKVDWIYIIGIFEEMKNRIVKY